MAPPSRMVAGWPRWVRVCRHRHRRRPRHRHLRTMGHRRPAMLRVAPTSSIPRSMAEGRRSHPLAHPSPGSSPPRGLASACRQWLIAPLAHPPLAHLAPGSSAPGSSPPLASAPWLVGRRGLAGGAPRGLASALPPVAGSGSLLTAGQDTCSSLSPDCRSCFFASSESGLSAAGSSSPPANCGWPRGPSSSADAVGWRGGRIGLVFALLLRRR